MAVKVPEKVQVVVRIDKDVVKQVDHLAVDWDSFRGETMERLLRMTAELVAEFQELLDFDPQRFVEMFKKVLEAMGSQKVLPEPA